MNCYQKNAVNEPLSAQSEDDDVLTFAEETVDDKKKDGSSSQWKVIIADDDDEVHKITKIVLEDYTFDDKPLLFYDTYSAEETKQVIQEDQDVAVVLLDVVMEKDDAGLELVKYIRENLRNKFVRIILRTGQPGKAPERRVIIEYDINDYKEKTELTAQKLFTTLTASLRAYRDLRTIEKSRRGLEQIIDSSAFLFDTKSLTKFAEGLLTQLLSILNLDESSLYLQMSGFAASQEKDDMVILAATGKYKEYVNKPADTLLPENIQKHLNTATRQKQSIFIDDVFIGYFLTKNGSKNLLFVKGTDHLSDIDKQLIEIFSTNVAIAFENLFLNREMIETQKEVIIRLGEVVETRSKETAYHVQRVAELSYFFALKSGLGEEQAELLRNAAPMHDVGKVGIPDAILLKPDKLTPQEYEIIKNHTVIGYEILKHSNRELIRAAAIVAYQHHERWDGSGYPCGLKGEQIHIFGRILGIVDVYDALLHKRDYKEAWSMDKVLAFIEEKKGSFFDPTLVDIFFASKDEFNAINNKYPEE